MTRVGQHEPPRYDGHADWYDAWTRGAGADAMAQARDVLIELVPRGTGVALDIGCGTGAHAAAVRAAGYQVVGIDYSVDQLRHATARLLVARGDARTLPVATGSAAVAYSMLTHTDIAGFDRVVADAVRALRTGGVFVYVGVHPCFVHPFAEPLPDGLRLHPGYRNAGWTEPTAFTGIAVRARVGVHHLPLAELISAFVQHGARLDRVVERGGDTLPQFLGLRLRRA